MTIVTRRERKKVITVAALLCPQHIPINLLFSVNFSGEQSLCLQFFFCITTLNVAKDFSKKAQFEMD